MLYGSENWHLQNSGDDRLREFRRNILAGKCGPINSSGV
jgi:hypothetical protein